MPSTNQVDIAEDSILSRSPELLSALLKDQTTSSASVQCNIFWATNDYAHLGNGYQYSDPILPPLITGKQGRIIMPRALKEREQQRARTKERSDVFTPAWLCNRMNNAADEQWFGRPPLFNRETCAHTWRSTSKHVVFPRGMRWQHYVQSRRIEITCGEAPFLVSRYDSTTGKAIPVKERIGLFDRKLRIVCERCKEEADWLKWAIAALKSIYGYEWQGDNLLLARENLLFTFIDYYREQFATEPSLDLLMQTAEVISWNVWQMDGLNPNRSVEG